MPPKKQSRRVAAWIYVVINPIIGSLEREISLLDSGNLTWRAYSRRCEMIKAIQQYVDSTQWPNYEDFVAEHAEFATKFKHHDSDVDSLNNVAHALFDRLLSFPTFSVLFRAAMESYETRRASLGPRAQSLADMGEGVQEEAVQHLINNVQELPSHYIISPFWNSEGRGRLASLRSDATFLPLIQSKDSVLRHSANLKQELENHRLALSREYDVPAAPVPGVPLES